MLPFSFTELLKKFIMSYVDDMDGEDDPKYVRALHNVALRTSKVITLDMGKISPHVETSSTM